MLKVTSEVKKKKSFFEAILEGPRKVLSQSHDCHQTKDVYFMWFGTVKVKSFVQASWNASEVSPWVLPTVLAVIGSVPFQGERES